MPRFFIDISNGPAVVEDKIGHELPSPEAARTLALDALPNLAREKILDDVRQTIGVSIRDESGAIIYNASLMLAGRWAGSS